MNSMKITETLLTEALLTEISNYKKLVTNLNKTLRETMELKDHWQRTAVKVMNQPNYKADNMESFFKRIQFYINDKITVVNGKYMIEPLALKKLMEMFKRELH